MQYFIAFRLILVIYRLLVYVSLTRTYNLPQCLLVKGWKGTSWSFPRGKKNKDEEDHACAIREVHLSFFFVISVDYSQ